MPDAPASSDLRSDKDNRLIGLSKQFNKAIDTKDVVLGKLEPLLAENVVYHADEVSPAGRSFLLHIIYVACGMCAVSYSPVCDWLCLN